MDSVKKKNFELQVAEETENFTRPALRGADVAR